METCLYILRILTKVEEILFSEVVNLTGMYLFEKAKSNISTVYPTNFEG